MKHCKQQTKGTKLSFLNKHIMNQHTLENIGSVITEFISDFTGASVNLKAQHYNIGRMETF
jgi:hypothetical protein